MTSAFWARPLAGAALDAQLSQLLNELDDWGTVRYADEQPNANVRQIRIEVDVSALGAPGARFVYAETYKLAESGWVLTEYYYNLIDTGRGRFLAYHHHPVPGVTGTDTPITHSHCRPLGAVDHDHYRATWVDVREAHWIFVACAADKDEYPDCGALKVLVPDQ